MALRFFQRITAQLSAGVSSSDVTFVVKNVDARYGGDLSNPEYRGYIGAEVVTVTAATNNGDGTWTLTVERASSGTATTYGIDKAIEFGGSMAEDVTPVPRHEQQARLQRSISRGEVIIFDPRKIQFPVFNSGVDTRFDLSEGGEGDVTHTRGSKAWYWDEDGNLRELDSHAAGLYGSGHRWEPERTNLLLWSEAFENAAWTKQNSTTVDANVKTAPDGQSTADRINAPGVAAAEAISQTFVLSSANDRYVAQLWIMADSLTSASFGIYNATDSLWPAQTARIVSGPGTIAGTSYKNVTGLSTTEWTLVEVSLDAAILAAKQLRLYVYPGDAATIIGGAVFLWGTQAEQAPVASSYIKTEGTTVTRSAGYTYDARWKRADAHIVSQPAATNLCQRGVNPVDTTGWTLGGDAAATLTVVDDYAELKAKGLHHVCLNGKVFKLDNSGGSTVARADSSGDIASTGVYTGSVYARGGSGELRDTEGNIFLATITAQADYTRFSGSATLSNTLASLRVQANAGQIIYFILPQLESGSVATEVIPNPNAASLARNADNFTTPYAQEIPWRRGLTVQIKLDPRTTANLGEGQFFELGDAANSPRLNFHRASNGSFRAYFNPASTSYSIIFTGVLSVDTENVIHIVLESIDDAGNGKLRAWVNGAEETAVAVTLPTYGATWSGKTLTIKNAWEHLFSALVVPGVFLDPSVLEALISEGA